MDKEQNRKFEEWYKRADSFHGLHDKVICEIAWQACLDANKVEDPTCPCHYTKPCSPGCSCINPFSSVGCRRCAGFGSSRQREATAKKLASIIDEKEQEEPTPTEMVRKLLDEGWKFLQEKKYADNAMLFQDPDTKSLYFEIADAYRKAFPSKKKIEIEVWTKNGKVRNILKEDVPYLEGWTKGIAIFWVEDSGDG